MDANLLKRWFVGKPMSLAQASHERLSKTVALAVFSSDAMSSVAYATEEILLILILAGAAATHLSVPLAIAITGVLRRRRRLVPADDPRLSLGRRVLHRGPGEPRPDVRAGRGRGPADRLRAHGGGQRRRRRGRAHLGRSRAAHPPRRARRRRLSPLIAFANLRGVRESGRIFAVPTYLFIATFAVLVGTGLYRALRGELQPLPAHAAEASDRA